MKENYLASRKIEVDTAHRVPFHSSMCKFLHGHRYTVEAFARGPLEEGGSQSGMVVDFSILKKLMIDTVHSMMDHNTVLYKRDGLINALFSQEVLAPFNGSTIKYTGYEYLVRRCMSTYPHSLDIHSTLSPDDMQDHIATCNMNLVGLPYLSMDLLHDTEYVTVDLGVMGDGHASYDYVPRLLSIPCIPTAENLARYIYNAMNIYLEMHKHIEHCQVVSTVNKTPEDLRIVKIVVQETPNCHSVYPE